MPQFTLRAVLLGVTTVAIGLTMWKTGGATAILVAASGVMCLRDARSIVPAPVRLDDAYLLAMLFGSVIGGGLGAATGPREEQGPSDSS
jgi:hypothetical protein